MALTANSSRLAVGGKAPNIILYALSLTTATVGINVLHKFKTHGSLTLTLSLDHKASLLVAGGDSKVRASSVWRASTPIVACCR